VVVAHGRRAIGDALQVIGRAVRWHTGIPAYRLSTISFHLCLNMHAMLHHPKTARDERGIGQRSVGRWIRAGAVEIRDAADWLTNTLPVRLIDSATPASSATSIACSMTSWFLE